MQLSDVTHQFGPWGPARFVPIPFHDGPAPAFYVTTTRMCIGVHDWRCVQVETQTFGPLVLEGKTQAELVVCGNCHRVQPPVDSAATGQEPVCLGCTDMATVQHLGDSQDTTVGLTAVAALNGASGTLRLVKEVDSSGYLALLDETGDTLRALLDDAAWAIHQDPRRARYSGYKALVLVARQIMANGRDLARIDTDPILPVRNDGE